MWRVIRLVAGGGLIVVLGAAVLMLWPLLWPPDPDASVQLVNGRLIGETAGYVGRVDREAHTVDVSSSLVGWRPIVLLVNEQTAILVQDRQGGLGDLLKDLPVRVSYEVVGETRLARSIEIITDDGGRSRAAASTAVKPAGRAQPVAADGAAGALRPVESTTATPPAATSPGAAPPAAPRPSPPPSAAKPPVAPPPPAAVEQTPVALPPRAPAPSVVRPSPPPTAAVRPAPRVEPPARAPDPRAGAEPARDVRTPPRADSDAPSAAPSPPRASSERPPGARGGPADADSGDGAAAVDWLLGRGR